MKRLIVLFFVAMFGVALFSSCKSADCPAYAKVDSEQVEPVA